MRSVRMSFLCAALVVIAGCSNDGLRSLVNTGNGPDEFGIVPGKPLQTPADFTELPVPTPGGANITDQTPLADGAAALGGRLPVSTGAIPAADTAILAHASRFGRDAAIREELAAADEAFRKRRGRFTGIRLVRTDRYFQVYKPLALDAEAEALRWRRAGARTPSAPLD